MLRVLIKKVGPVFQISRNFMSVWETGPTHFCFLECSDRVTAFKYALSRIMHSIFLNFYSLFQKHCKLVFWTI